ncbi:MAG: uroporphyrinogen decarboxylase family protein [Candidatus Hodarchaeota archaeon]
MKQNNYQLLKAVLDHEEPERVPSFHLGYASRVLEQSLLEYREPSEEDVCLYYDKGPEPRQGLIDLTIDHILGYTGHYRGIGFAHRSSLGSYYAPGLADRPFSERFFHPRDSQGMDSALRSSELWHVGSFGSCTARRAKAGPKDEGFTSYYVDGVLTPDTFDEWLACNEYGPSHPNVYKLMGSLTRDIETRLHDWSFPVIGTGGVCDATIMTFKGNWGAFAKWKRRNPSFIDRVAKWMFEILRDYVYVPLLEAGVPFIYWGEDLGQKSRLLVSPGDYQRFFARYLAELAKLVHSYDARLVMHSDGNVSEIVPVLVKCGIDGLQALEPASGMSLGDMVKKHGDKLAFLGALDQRVLCWGSVDDTIQMVKDAVKEGARAGGRFALGPSHQPIGAKAENMFTMMEAIQRFGRYPIEMDAL